MGRYHVQGNKLAGGKLVAQTAGSLLPGTNIQNPPWEPFRADTIILAFQELGTRCQTL